MKDRFLGCLLGLAVGDAVGTTLEFKPRGTFRPISDMVGGGPFNLPIGAWTDDTSMALCLATSLVQQERFDPIDQMNRYCNWYQHGYLSSTGDCFDIGNTTAAALGRFLHNGNPNAGSTDPMTAGNGSIMRLAPVPMFYYGDEVQVVHFSAESSRTTHASAECLDACSLFGSMLHLALQGASKSEILNGSSYQPATTKIRKIAQGDYTGKSAEHIRGSGYVVDSLEAALWCFVTTHSYRDAVLTAANLGDDADTTAAVVGQIAGAHYGATGIPSDWLAKVVMHSEIEELALALHQHSRML